MDMMHQDIRDITVTLLSCSVFVSVPRTYTLPWYHVFKEILLVSFNLIYTIFLFHVYTLSCSVFVTVELLNNGHTGRGPFVFYMEVVQPFIETEIM